MEHVRVARALRELPELATEMRRGRLSYSQVRAISRVVEQGDGTVVSDLIQAAQHCSIGQLESVVRGMRTVERIEDGTDDRNGYLRQGWGSDGHWCLSARLDPERGAVVRSAITAVARAEGISHADALVRISEIALAALGDSEHPPRPLRGDERAAVVVHLDARSTIDKKPTRGRGGPSARIADGPGLANDVVERLLCSSRIRAVQHDTLGNIRDLGRSRRLVSDRLFRALLLRDHRHCVYPGCESRAGLQAHHVRHWLDGGPTDLDNLVLLCERHHHAHHDGAFAIERVGRRRFAFHRRDGSNLSDPPTPARLAARQQAVDAAHRDVADDAATTRWDGASMDRHFAVGALTQARSRERGRVS